MFRANAPSPQFHTSVVSAHTQHDHFGLYMTPSDTRARALTNAVDHLLQQVQRTGAPLRPDTRALVATGGRPGPAAHVAARSGACVVAACTSDSVAADEFNDRLNIMRAASSDAVFAHDDASFDVVMSIDALAAAQDKRGMLAHAFRVLKEGGLLAVMDVVARPGAHRADLVPFEKAMAVPPLITLHSYEKLLHDVGFVLMRTCDLSAHVVMSYKQIITRARDLREKLHDCSAEDVDDIVKQLEEDVRRMRDDDTIGWTSFVALKKFEDERDGKMVVE
ncbi:Phosphoethanolamine N-methyltransferase 1 [Gracilariopsis chorda]|uniref:phosphoethanolamine N-methyltransferase n=1 Tax=Gracilariopsis chorda TaxID=448386 RepID=A0A2V3J0X7_9FLOR|nr:Phosphoethanolamine N-methyltransferase 1 [Gracilariopsis chorda]|eukprot:PXF48028.1 Phosphoethanolamine N-methyltransferase 1 [Gracilariopsis chorda]